MKAIKCKVCDSNDLVMDGDFLVCQYCGTRYTLDTARTMLGTVKVEGVVQTRNADFEIKAGRLVGYSGESRQVIVPEGVDAIGREAFKDSNIVSVQLPDSVTKIEYGAFYGCRELSRIDFPKGLRRIENQAFWYCESLIEISLPASVEVYASSFRESGIESVTLAPGLRSIPDSAFYGVTKLKTISIPDSVTQIGSQAFGGCRALTSINMPRCITKIGGRAFEGCSSLTSITIPEGVTEIEYNTFSNCEWLRSVQLPNTLKSIGERAFEYCKSLKSITIPNSVIEIGAEAFANCTSLANVQVSASCEMGWRAFGGTLYEKLQWQRKGLCQHCGGEFRGIVNRVCTKCGRPKDYR